MAGNQGPVLDQTVDLNVGAPTPVDSTKIPLLTEPFQTPEILVDGVASIAVAGNMLRLTLFAERQAVADGPGTISRVVVGRLALSPQSADFVAITLRTVLDQLAANGMIPPLSPVNVT